MKRILLSLLLVVSTTSVSFADSLTVSRRLDDLEHSVKRIDVNQLNYSIEKDLLKETYSNNYERINITISIILGLIALLGFLGLRDINSTRKEYVAELEKLKELQSGFEEKSRQFDEQKRKVDNDLKDIISQNEEQNKKIKFLELKAKLISMMEDNAINPSLALEFANAAIDLNNTDSHIISLKGSLLIRLNRLNEATQLYDTALGNDPLNSVIIANAVECFYFAKEFTKAKKLIKENSDMLAQYANGNLLTLLDIIEMFHQGSNIELLKAVKDVASNNSSPQTTKGLAGWQLKEALYFVSYQPDSACKKILQNLFWYWDGQIGVDVLMKMLEELDRPSVA